MVNRDEWLIQRHCRCFCKVHTNQYRADKTRSIGNGYCINIFTGKSGVCQGLVCKTINCFNMLAGCKFRNNASVNTVKIYLGSDTIGQDLSSISNNGNSSFIAGRFHSKNIHRLHSFLKINASSLGLR